MLHFGYGSNLQMSFLKEILPSAKYVMKAYIPNHEIQFNFFSKTKQAGISNIMLAPGKVVHGVIFDVPEKELMELDVKPGFYIGDYERRTFLAVGEDNKLHSTELYQVIDPQGPFQPSKEYVKGMLEGAREMDLDPTHLKTIEQFYADSI